MFGWNWPSGSGEEDEHVSDGQTDDRGSEMLTWAISSGELRIKDSEMWHENHWNVL